MSIARFRLQLVRDMIFITGEQRKGMMLFLGTQGCSKLEDIVLSNGGFDSVARQSTCNHTSLRKYQNNPSDDA